MVNPTNLERKPLLNVFKRNAKSFILMQNVSYYGDKMPERKRYEKRVSVALESELLKKLEELSQEKGISIAGLIRMAVREWLHNQ